MGYNQNTVTDNNEGKKLSLVFFSLAAREVLPKSLPCNLAPMTDFTKGKLNNCEVVIEPLPLWNPLRHTVSELSLR